MQNRQNDKKPIPSRLHLGSFMDKDMIDQLEPNINRHFLGTTNNVSKTPKTLKIPKTPPPLPNVPSSSEQYTKKIASFKKKLKLFKNSGTTSNTASRKPRKPTVPLSVMTQFPPTQTSPILNDFKHTDNIGDYDSNNDISYQNNNYYNKEPSELSLPITPLFTSSPTVKIRSLVKEKKCCICNLDLDVSYNVQDTERIIELSCQHMIHEECLLMEIDLNLSLTGLHITDKQKVMKLLPLCSFCDNNSKCIPVHDDVLTDCYTHIITNQMTKPFKSINSSLLSLGSPSTTAFSDNSKYIDTLNTPISYSPQQNNTTAEDFIVPVEKHITINNELNSNNSLSPNLKTHKKSTSQSKKIPFPKTHSKKPSRGSFALGTSSIVTSSHNPNTKSHNSYNHFSFDNFQEKIIDDLVELSEYDIIKSTGEMGFSLTPDFIKSLGMFRMVDKINLLTINKDGESSSIKENYCYLFQHMLLHIRCDDYMFGLVSINLSTFIDSSEAGSILIKKSKNSKEHYKLIFNSKGLESKWRSALSNLKLNIEPPLITSTLKVNEFDDLLDEYHRNNEKANAVYTYDDNADLETLGTLKSYVGEDGHRRLPTGVCPRFYEGTINSLIFQQKPLKAIILINQSKLIKSSIISIQNMVKSLLMIGIDILLLLCSTSTLSMESNVIDSCEIDKSYLKNINDLANTPNINGKNQTDIINDTMEKYRQFLEMYGTIGYSDNDSLNNKIKNETIEDKISNYVEKSKHSIDVSDMILIAVSNTSIKKLVGNCNLTNILIEVGLDSRQKTYNKNIVDLADWNDIMEVVCGYCGLEFDESDFYVSSDDEDEEGYDSSDYEADNSYGILRGYHDEGVSLIEMDIRKNVK